MPNTNMPPGLQGPTDTSGVPIPPKPLSPWDKFVSGLMSARSDVGSAYNFFTQDMSGTTQANQELVLKQKAKDKLAELSKNQTVQYGTRNNVVSNIAENIDTFGASVVNKSTDILLNVAKAINDKFISPLITRPVATAALVLDPKSELYKKDKYGKGFQLKDILTAYNKSKEVSFGQAFASNSLYDNSLVSTLTQPVSDLFGGPKFGKVNVFDPKAIKENYVDNVFGKYFTGSVDVLASIPEFGGLGKGLGLLGKYAAVTSGAVAKGGKLEAAVKFEADVKTGLDHIATGGLTGTPTNAAQSVARIAESKNPKEVYDIFHNYSNNRDLIPFLVAEKDPTKIADLILADNKYLPAMERVLVHNDVAAYAAMGGHEALVSKLFLSDGAFIPEDGVLKHIHDIHVKSILENPEHKAIWDALMNPEFNASRGLGIDKYPLEGIVGNALSQSRGFVETYLGSHNNVTTRLISLAGSRLPKQYVSLSQTRSWDGVKELESEFDSLKLFRNPDNLITISPGKAIKAGDYRKIAVSRYLAAKNDIERFNAVKEIDMEMGKSLALSKEIYNLDEATSIIGDLQDKIYGGHSAITQKGYGMEIGGDHVALDIHAKTQLAGTYRMVPWDQVERALELHVKSNAGRVGMHLADTTQQAFNSIVKGLSVSMIVKPSYILKQSMMEPTIGAVVALGPKYLTSQVGSATRNFFDNNLNRISEAMVKGKQFTAGERKAVINKVALLGNKLEAQLNVHNLIQEEFDAFFVSKVKTPKTVELYGAEVAKNYKDSARAVAALEKEYNQATIRWGVPGEVPSQAGLIRRLDHLEKLGLNPGIINKIQIIRSKLAADRTHGSIFRSSGELAQVENNLTDSYGEIDNLLGQLSVAQSERYRVFEKTLKYKERTYGQDKIYEMIDGRYMLMPKVFDNNAVGQALREEVSNASTVATTYGDELTRSVRDGIMRRHNPRVVTKVSDPRYYDELAMFINRQWKQDDFYKLILAGQSPEELTKWALSSPGVTYMRKMGVESADEARHFVSSAYDRVNHYLPSKEVQVLISKKEIYAPELEKYLYPHVGQLMPIHPRDFNYEEINSGLGNAYTQKVSNLVGGFFDKSFQVLMRPENPLRWSYIEQRATQINAGKARMLVAQGKKINMDDLNALREASFQEATAEMEKVFYTIPRANRAIYALRPLTMFPTATFNAFYRYSRLAVKQPARMAAFTHYYDSMFKSFGVDQYGNPTDDNTKVTHIVVPATKDLGWFKGEGMKIGVKSIGFILNAPTLSPFQTVPISMLVRNKPEVDGVIRGILGSNYNTLFPYGTDASTVFSSITPSWARDAVSWLRSPASTTAYLNSVQSIYDYHQVKVGMGLEKSMPTTKQINTEVNNLWKLRALYEFASPTGMPIKVETNPMSLFKQLYFGLMNTNKKNGMTQDEAQKKAEIDFLAVVGPKFPISTITFTGSTARANIAKTQEGYARVFKDNVGLVKQLVHINPSNPFVVSLLTTDINVTDANRSQVVATKLAGKEMTLPDINGTVLLNDPRQTPQKIQEQRENQKIWDMFFKAKDLLDASAQTLKNRRGEYYKSMESVPVYREALKDYALNVLGKENPTWLMQDYNAGGSGDNSFIYATGLKMITDNNKFMMKNSEIPFFRDAAEFTALRNYYVSFYEKYPQKQKSAVKKAYEDMLFGNPDTGQEGKVSTYDPKLQKIIMRYFLNDNMKKAGGYIGN